MMALRTRTLCTAGAAVLAALGTAYQAGLRVNTTPSMPIGLWASGSAHTVLTRGDVVTVCLPGGAVLRQAMQRGYIATGTCPHGAEPLVKPVAAVSGDLVTVSANGIDVNATPIANTAALPRDEAGRVLHPIPAASYRVGPEDVWLLSGHDPRSFDSRYFGAVPVANVLGIAHPLWVLR
jgi:conjugative transfer signal peptidase TraF